MSAISKQKITITAIVAATAVLTVVAVMFLTPWRPWADDTGGPPERPVGTDLADRIDAFAGNLDEDGGYRRPTPEERRAVAAGVGLLLDGRATAARQRLAEVDFGLRTLTDETSGRTYAEVADHADESVRGWGRVYVDLSTEPAWSVQVPHPVADQDTERLGVDVLRGNPGGVLVLAGAHRDAGTEDQADVAHRRDTIFHVVCRELAERLLPGIQLHGFANDSLPGEQAIVSTGFGEQARKEARLLADALEGEDFDVCRGWESRCRLEGHSNTQGRLADLRDLEFLHLELNHDVRTDEARARQAVEAVNGTVATWT